MNYKSADCGGEEMSEQRVEAGNEELGM